MGADRIPFACDGRHVVVGEYENSLTMDATGRGEPESGEVIGFGDSVALSPGGSWAEVSRGELRVRPARGPEWVAPAPDLSEGLGLAFSPDGAALACGRSDGAVAVIDVATRRERELRDDRVAGAIRCVAFSPDGGRLAAGTGDHPNLDGADYFPGPGPRQPHRVAVWDLRSGDLEAALPEQVGPVYAVAFSPDGSAVVSAGQDRVLRFWDVAGRGPLGELEWHLGAVRSLAFSPDGEWLATGGGDGLVRLWPWRRLLQA
jgi:WD40 repeat protein